MTLAKHFLTSPPDIVLDALRALAAANSQLAFDEGAKVLHIANPDPSRVAVVCGGGSGHEPAHAGFVGDGMLTAAVCGNIFASPNASQVRRALDLVRNDKGILIIVKNYTGDVLNFGLAKEQYAALHPDYIDRLRVVVVADDVAVGKEQGAIVGRRGLAGTILVYKIAGAMARQGASLAQVHSIAQYVADRLVTVGVGLDHTHIPGTPTPSSRSLSASELEIGMGIHNEPGAERLGAPPLPDLMDRLLDMLIGVRRTPGSSEVRPDDDRGWVKFKSASGHKGVDEVVMIVNNLGGLSELELGAIQAEACRAVTRRGIKVRRVWSGPMMTSLNMPGFSVTFLLLPTPGEDVVDTEALLAIIDQKPSVPGWRWSAGSDVSALGHQPDKTDDSQMTKNESRIPPSTETKGRMHLEKPDSFISAIQRACKALIAAEPDITRMDTIAGDGDCGMTLQSGAEGVLKAIDAGSIEGDDVITSVISIGRVAEEAMGGTSGALYSLFFSALAQGLQSQTSTTGDQALQPQTWAVAVTSALDRLYMYTRARRPSRTLIDPLSAFVEALVEQKGSSNVNFTSAVGAAARAAEDTANMRAMAGRSAYVEGDRLQKESVPDPGAWGVKIIVEALMADGGRD